MRRLSPTLAAALALAAGCSSPEPEVNVIRLQDVFGSARVENSPAVTEALPRTEWTFDDGDDGWTTGVGVRELRVAGGRLTGRSTTDFPIVHVPRSPTGVDDSDLLHAIEVRARVSAGNNLQVDLGTSDEPDFRGILQRAEIIPWRFSTPVIPGDEPETYVINVLGSSVRGNQDLSSAAIERVLVRPTDAADAEFEIDSVRLIFREEHLATIESGVSLQGFQSIYRETLVTRAPETVSFELTLPSSPRLELTLATVEEAPLTFRVVADTGDQESVLLNRTLTTPHRWEGSVLDLDGFANTSITLKLSLESEKVGALGFWGAPAIRDRTGAAPHSADAPQAVILFVADTLRRDHLEAYGYERETAPHLTAIARNGALFEDNQTQAPWTRPSVASILTSLYPTTHGVKTTQERVPASATTIAELYRDAGYATAGFTSNGFIGRGSNLHQGFEEFHESGSIERPDGQSSSKTARLYMDRFVPWLKAHRDVPFFAYFHVTDPHSRYKPYRPYDSAWAGPEADQSDRLRRLGDAIEDFADVNPNGQPTRKELARAGVDADAFVAHEKAWYDGSIRAMDAEIGRMIETIEELGLTEKIVFAFIGDHGEEFLEHDGHWHDNVYGENTNVPLILWAPGRIPAGTVVSETVRSIDLMPTLLEMSGLSAPDLMQGQSLTPLFAATGDARWQPQPAVTELKQADRAPKDNPDLETFALVDNGWKLVRNEVEPEGAPEWQLFDHRKDPLNQVDVSAEHPEVLERMKTLLEDWHKYAQAARLPEDADAAEGMSSEELERLRSLGYIQ